MTSSKPTKVGSFHSQEKEAEQLKKKYDLKEEPIKVIEETIKAGERK